MKKILSIIVVMCSFCVAMAQNPMVTLSHDGQLTFFTDLGAFNSAVSVASEGDTIYLSQGSFILTGGSCSLKKDLNIVGNGYDSHILGELVLSGFTNSRHDYLIDGVRIDHIYFNHGGHSNRENSYVNKAEIKRCMIGVLENGCTVYNDVLYDKCVIEKADFNGYGNVVVQNSKLAKVTSGSNIDKAVNCNIDSISYYPSAMISCILKNGTSEPKVSTNSNPSIINSLLDFTPSDSKVTTRGCYFYTGSETLLDDDMECPLDLTTLGYLGEDGTVVGIHGGEYPFSENPSLPSVDAKKSSVEYDAASNKLKVSITVKAD